MKKLSTAAQSKIAAFLTGDQPRPLEKSLYRYHFAGGSQADVLAALAGFQNPDGGFGHGLECDLRLPDSSVIATSIAFQRLREIHSPADHSVVVNGSRYLRDTYDPATSNWEIIPPNIDDAPHAPWWVYGGDLSQSRLNPRAEVLGYLYDYPDHFPAEMRQQLTESVVEHLLNMPDEVEMHDLFCAIRFYETPSLPEAIKARIFPKLKAAAEAIVTRDSAGWAEYGLQPLGVVTSPDSAFAPSFRSELEVNLDFIIDQLDEASYWGPNWTWGPPSEAWTQAEKELRGVITLNNLSTLRAFGRLE